MKTFGEGSYGCIHMGLDEYFSVLTNIAYNMVLKVRT